MPHNKPSLRILIAGTTIFLGLACLPAGASISTNVHFGSFYFRSNNITISPGDTVVWINDGGVHTVTGTGAEAMCGSGTVSTSCSHTFTTPGTYPYLCAIPGHASLGMTGVVHVVSAPVVAPAALTNAIWLPNGSFKFTVHSTANHTNFIQATTNAASSTNWVLVATVVPTNSVFTFTDTNAGSFGIRLYRVVEP